MIANRLEALEDINDSENLNHKQGLKHIKENIKTSSKQSRSV